MKRAVALLLFVFCPLILQPAYSISQSVLLKPENPIPEYLPYALMTSEVMDFVINDDLTVDMHGTYTFKMTYMELYGDTTMVDGFGHIRKMQIHPPYPDSMYVIESDSGEILIPGHLNSDFKTDGQYVRFAGEVINDPFWQGIGTWFEIYILAKWNEGNSLWDYTFTFPVPPDAEDIYVSVDDTLLDWRWSEEMYETTVDTCIAEPPAMLCEWPMFSWDIALHEGTVVMEIGYTHSLVPHDDNLLFVYSLGTGRYAEGWNPPIIGAPSGKPDVAVTIDIDYPPYLHPLDHYPTPITTTQYPSFHWHMPSIEPREDFVVVFSSDCTAVSVDGGDTIAESNYSLYENYPNPFNPSTTIRFHLPQPEHVTLKVYNALGQEVTTLIDNVLRTGDSAVTWDASGMASGIYFYRMTAGPVVKTGKMLLIK